MNTPRLHAFTGYGIEIEQMIVHKENLAPMPIADQLLQRVARTPASEVERGMLAWSNEMVMHVIEIKNPRPISLFQVLPAAFQEEVRYINRSLESFGARLMPTAMHPWMDPRRDTHLWPYDNVDIYRTYDKIFDCRRHGWANLQSMHINLPFADDREFARLHAAVRLLLPILPALAASSPIADGKATGFADYRMEAYRHNADQFQSIAGRIVPDTISSRAEYEEKVLAPMYRDIASHDPQRILRREWLNSRGAIARFDRYAIEIRVIDTQECPRADLAIATAVIAILKELYREEPRPLAAQQEIETNTLEKILLDCIRDADQAHIDCGEYLQLMGFPGSHCSAGELWHYLIQKIPEHGERRSNFGPGRLQVMLEQGPLARRILRALGTDFSSGRLQEVYRELCDCLQEGQMFQP